MDISKKLMMLPPAIPHPIWPTPESWLKSSWAGDRRTVELWNKVRDRLDDLIQSGGEICFCSNTMLDRGSVYTCTINENGEAIIKSKHTWWSCKFSDPTTDRAGEILGKITIERMNGCEGFRPCCGGLKEGRG